jgi:hypothetical protein
MKITFENGGYVEFQRSLKPHHVHISVAARKEDNPLELLINSGEIHIQDLKKGLEEVSINPLEGQILSKEK